mmetsp:Transcript_87974/g.226821  ORF Transcript_87974/g.226821 Transcript_87974/m.226821 type:complete len:365 (+) Transcript_87974:839-1933(+)
MAGGHKRPLTEHRRFTIQQHAWRGLWSRWAENGVGEAPGHWVQGRFHSSFRRLLRRRSVASSFCLRGITIPLVLVVFDLAVAHATDDARAVCLRKFAAREGGLGRKAGRFGFCLSFGCSSPRLLGLFPLLLFPCFLLLLAQLLGFGLLLSRNLVQLFLLLRILESAEFRFPLPLLSQHLVVPLQCQLHFVQDVLSFLDLCGDLVSGKRSLLQRRLPSCLRPSVVRRQRMLIGGRRRRPRLRVVALICLLTTWCCGGLLSARFRGRLRALRADAPLGRCLGEVILQRRELLERTGEVHALRPRLHLLLVELQGLVHRQLSGREQVLRRLRLRRLRGSPGCRRRSRCSLSLNSSPRERLLPCLRSR